MNRPPPDDSRLSLPHSLWATTSPSKFLDEPIRPRRVPPVPYPRRKPQLTSLTSQAHVWIARLPPHYQPLATARRHPHIINSLSEKWNSQAELQAYLNELMLSTRPDRGGFSFEVLSELADLQSMLDLKGGGAKF